VLGPIGTVQDAHAPALRALCCDAVDKDGADVIILAGAPLAGLARLLAGDFPVPVVDGVSSAVRHAQFMVAMVPAKASRGSYAPPPVKPHCGLPEAMRHLLDRTNGSR